MPANKKLLVLPGDGIGPEVMREVRRVIDWMDRRRMVTFDVSEDLVGGAAHRRARHADHRRHDGQGAREADAVLFGSVGGPKWDKLGFDMRPELAILRLRKELDLFANLRPAIVLDPLVDASHAEARGGARPRSHDRAREHRRHLFRRAARHRDAAGRPAARLRHRESTPPARSSASPASAFELARKRQNRRVQRREGQRDAVAACSGARP